ncbi:putative dna-directed rna polymerase ii subunit [Phaeomoniella chlamydospora]|uniref:Putative dna-directed rna polymerase ii subunit n=1 Tax=Phaeomoniella chlamydospora TaxID=158046 RepID=A0A0G2F2V7_PHACM|nr:putative dna-directed rna polymerase ii subunit [Phaeomoniella chlamydospora]
MTGSGEVPMHGASGYATGAPNAIRDYLPEHIAHNARHGPSVNYESDNAPPDRFESFLLGAGEKKITSQVDTRMPNTVIFTLNKEDHTLGNLLKSRLLQNPNVLFSGYKVPHPMFPTVELRVQTNGEVTPKDALIGACTDLVNDLSTLSREFTKEFELRKMVGAGQNGNNGQNGQ